MRSVIAIALLFLCTTVGEAQRVKDRKAPTITIRMPTAQAAYTTDIPTIMINGTANDNIGVTKVTWHTDRGQQGVAKGMAAWSFSATLLAGKSVLTVEAVDAAGNRGEDRLTVTVTTPPPPPGPLMVEWIYSSTVGDMFQMERCMAPCSTMQPVAAIAIKDRSWRDTTVNTAQHYCYRMAVLTGGALGPYSNTLCSP